MAHIIIASFRPRKDIMRDFDDLRLWCAQNDSSFCTVFNSFLPAITYLLRNNVIKMGGKRYVRCEDMGDIELLDPTCGPKPQRKIIYEDNRAKAARGTARPDLRGKPNGFGRRRNSK